MIWYIYDIMKNSRMLLFRRQVICSPMDCSIPCLLVNQLTSSTIFHKLLKFMSTELVMLSNHLTLLPPSPFAFSLSRHQGLFQWVGSSHQVAKVVDLQFHLSWTFRVNFLEDWLIWSPCNPWGSQESSPAPQFKSLSCSALSFLYGPNFPPIHYYWKNHLFD